MRARLRGAAVAASAAALAGALAGCGSSAEANEESAGECSISAAPTVLAAGGRANMPTVSVAQLDDYVKPAIDGGKSVLVLDTGGQPSAHGTVDFASTAANSEAERQEKARDAAKLKTILTDLVAKTPEANPLKALDTAAREIESKGGSGTIVLVDSGLQTTGVLDYTTGLLNADPGDVARSLDDRNQLPDLSGVNVIMLGIGDTAEPQASLDTAQRELLRDQWVAIAKKAGAACVYADPAPLTEPAVDSAPSVTPVKVPKSEVIKPANVVVLDNGSVPFISDSPELRDPEAAKRTLSDIAESLVQSGKSVELTGTTATDGTEEGRQKLSLARAETVKAILVALGVDESTISVRGVGINHAEHINDLDSGGNLIPNLAAKNRTVILRVQD